MCLAVVCVEGGYSQIQSQLTQMTLMQKKSQPSDDLCRRQHAVWACAMGGKHKLEWNFLLQSVILMVYALVS